MRPSDGTDPHASATAQACGSYSDPFDALAWICVQTHPQAEEQARKQLAQQGWETYFPRIWKRSPGRRGRFDWLFPRYGFVRLNLATQSWSPIQHTIGISAVIKFNAQSLALVQQADIDRIRAARFDRVTLTERAPVQDFTGKRFSALDGPWKDFGPAVCTWNTRDRIKLLHTLFGRETEVEYALSHVTLVPDGRATQTEGRKEAAALP